MAVLNLKNLPDELYAKLKERAKEERRSVAQQVTHMLAEALEAKKTRSIRDLRGLGREIWEGMDPVEHIERERASWD